MSELIYPCNAKRALIKKLRWKIVSFLFHNRVSKNGGLGELRLSSEWVPRRGDKRASETHGSKVQMELRWLARSALSAPSIVTHAVETQRRICVGNAHIFNPYSQKVHAQSICLLLLKTGPIYSMFHTYSIYIHIYSIHIPYIFHGPECQQARLGPGPRCLFGSRSTRNVRGKYAEGGYPAKSAQDSPHGQSHPHIAYTAHAYVGHVPYIFNTYALYIPYIFHTYSNHIP